MDKVDCQEQQLPIVSVIIPALNEQRHIGSCLESVLNGSYSRESIELIVVDNGSSDRTVEIARAWGAKVLELPGVTLGCLRNQGVRYARGAILAFIDADCIADSDWLEQGASSLAKEPCITGSFHDIPEEATWLEKAWFVYRERGRCETSHINTSNLFVTKELFEQLGGFDESLVTGEDSEFSARAKRIVKVISDERIRVVHLGNPKTLGEFMRREIWHGLGALGSFRVSCLDKPLLGTLGFLVCSIGQIVGIVALILGLGVSLLALSTAVLLSLLILTVWYRRRFILSPSHALKLGFIYYIYYFSRAISLCFLLCRRTRFRPRSS